MFTVYVIRSLNKDFTYVGLTDNLDRRFNQHNKGWGVSTKPYAPYKLIYTEMVETRTHARLRQKYLKSTAGKNFLRKMLGETVFKVEEQSDTTYNK
jgi:putative endonuclease